MQIRIESNFVITGLEGGDGLALEEESTLRQLLARVEGLSGLDFFPRGSEVLDPDDWEVDINNVPHYSYERRLETVLKDADLVVIRVVATGGG
jgi:hypothetical protein